MSEGAAGSIGSGNSLQYSSSDKSGVSGSQIGGGINAAPDFPQFPFASSFGSGAKASGINASLGISSGWLLVAAVAAFVIFSKKVAK